MYSSAFLFPVEVITMLMHSYGLSVQSSMVLRGGTQVSVPPGVSPENIFYSTQNAGRESIRQYLSYIDCGKNIEYRGFGKRFLVLFTRYHNLVAENKRNKYYERL